MCHCTEVDEKETIPLSQDLGVLPLFLREREAQSFEPAAHGSLSTDPAGFDLEQSQTLNTSAERLRLFEVKTCGVGRKAPVCSGFKGLGFTLTQKERQNAEVLGERYRFLFVNLRTMAHRECLITDFFTDNRARIY